MNYRLIEKELLHHCPVCKADVRADSIPFGQLDRYGFPVTSSWCRCCDALYINPRPTPDAYEVFYGSGDYRRLISAFSGQEDDHLLPQARVKQLASLMHAYVPRRPLSILNIGGTRADYEVLASHLSMGQYICLNPGKHEAGEGYTILPQTLETYSPQSDTFDIVCLLGTLNHLMEPGEAFKKIAQMMAPGSIFVFDFKDPLAKMARMTQPIGGLQFDHTTYPTLRTLGIMLQAAGLGLRAWHTDNQRLYSFIAARGSEETLPPLLVTHQSFLIDELLLRARRLPRRLALKSLCSVIRQAQ